MAIHMTTVVGSHLTVFEHMLQHYKDMGIDSLLINVQLDQYESPLYCEIKAITRRFRAEIVNVFVGKWLQSVNPYLYWHTLSQAPDDWFILADSDELQTYPGEIHSLISELHSEGYDFLEGFVIDRVAKDGSFPPVRDDVSLWEQFPLAGVITLPIIQGNTMKVAAAKGKVRLSWGQHYSHTGRGCPRDRYFIPVHHFKWTEGLIDRMKARIDFYRSVSDGLWIESEKVLWHCANHEGRINVAEPSFMLRESGVTCPHEAELKAVVLANESRMPRPC
jgi:hypothetical protein